MKRNKNKYIKEFVDYCLQSGYSEGLFLNERNVDEYVETSVDAYNGYPLFLDVFNGGYDAKTYTRMLRVDFKSRLGKTLGIATDNYESVLLLEPPEVPKTGMIQYLKAADMSSIPLFFNCLNFLAISNKLSISLAIISLFAVTTCFLFSNAFTIKPLAKS